MSATVDANVLVYASDTASPHHERAREFVTALSTGPGLIYLFWPTVMAYLRITTHPRIFTTPLAPKEAMGNITSLLDRPYIKAIGEESADFWQTYAFTSEGVWPRGNLIPDAHIVALMHQHGVSTIWTRDSDFRKFKGIEAKDPFAAS